MKFEFYEVEDRPVVVLATDETLIAWVWTPSAWREAPALVAKSAFWGFKLSQFEFEKQFPEADLAALMT